MDAGGAGGHHHLSGRPEAGTTDHPAASVEMPENTELDLDPAEVDMPHSSHGGLSPLMLGVLLGMMVLGAAVMWIVLQARIDDLETRFTQLDERLQVLVADTRRQGDTLRQLAGKPGALPPAALARGEPAEGQGAELEQAMAAQQQRIASLEKLLAGVKQELADSEARGSQAGRGAAVAPASAPAATTPAPPPAPVKPAPAPVATAAPRPRAVEPAEPPAGFAVILASLPERDLAVQELDRLRGAGVAAVLREARVGNGTWYRVQVEGFITRDAATGFARDVENRHGISGAWVLAP